jgi:TonB-linked SusC/RagA family outer membrane protein
VKKYSIALIGLLTFVCPALIHAQLSDSVKSVTIDTVKVVDSIVYGRTACPFTVTHETTLLRYAVTSPTRVLDGAIAGLQSTNGSGQPGTSPELLIRGMGTMNFIHMPLIVLNGAPYSGNISSLNLTEIATIKVLKDAMATLIYGSRGANGVIEIVTKDGKDHRDGKLSIDAKSGLVTRGIRDYDYIKDEKDYYETYLKSVTLFHPADQVVNQLGGYNSYNVPADQLFTSDGKINPNASLKYHDDWSKALQHVGLKHDYSVSFADNGKRGNYFLGTNYLNEQGYIRHTGFERFNLTFNGAVKITPWLKAGVNSTAAAAKQRSYLPGDASNPFLIMREMAPIYPVYYYNEAGQTETDPATGAKKYDLGSLSRYPESSVGDRYFYSGGNPVAALETDNFTDNNLSAVINPYVEAKVLKQFIFSAAVHYNYIRDHQLTEYFSNPDLKLVTDQKDNAKIYTVNQSFTWKPNFEYHHVKMVLAHENYKIDDDYDRETANITGAITGFERYRNINFLEGYHALAEYDFKSKYFLTAGFRRDGSKNMAPDRRWNNYWAAGAGYALEEENFLKGSRWLDELKIRVNYGTQGASLLPTNFHPFQDIDYRFVPLTNYQTFFIPDTYAQWNAGLDIGLFHSRIRATIDVYNRLTSSANLILPYLPDFPGRDFKIRNRGVELTLNTALIRQPKINWNAVLTLTHNQNKIVNTPEHRIFYGGYTRFQEGSSLNDIYLPEYAGVDPANGNALYYTVDAQGNKTTTRDIRVIDIFQYKNAGSIYPAFYGSLTNTISWKKFDFSFRLNFSVGGKYYDGIYQGLMDNFPTGNWHTDILNAWTPENTATDVPKIDVYNNGFNYPVSTRYVRDASYLSVKNVYIAYNFGRTRIKKAKLKELSIYLTGDNIWLFGARRGMDPQASFFGNPNSTYTVARTIMLGVRVGL